MPENSGTLESLSEGILKALDPLKQELEGGNLLAFFTSLGLTFPPSLASEPGFSTSIAQIIARSEEIPGLVTQLKTAIEAEDYGQIIQAIIRIANTIKGFLEAFVTLKTSFENIQNNFPGEVVAGDIAAFAAQVPEKLFGWLLITHLEAQFPLWVRILHMTDIVQIEPVAGDGNATGPSSHYVKRLNFGAIQNMFTDPAAHFVSVYQWGDPAFDGKKLLRQLFLFAQTFSFPLKADLTSSTPSLSFSVAKLAPYLPATGDKGLELTINSPLPSNFELEIPFIFDNTNLKIEIDADLPKSTGVRFFPKGKIEIVPPDTSQINGEVTFTVIKKPAPPATELMLFGESGGSRFVAKSLSGGMGMGVSWNGTSATGNYRFFLRIEKGEIIITLGGGDGFISSIAPSELRMNADLLIGYSTVSGFYFEGSAGLQLMFPTHIEIGPIELQGLILALKLAPQLAFEIGANIRGNFGPLQAVVENIGLRALFTFPSNNSGNLGPVDIGFEFKPPNGVGLSLDAGVVKGGGYLFFDFDNEEYAGVLELSIAEIVTVKAIGLITTKMPDGSKGFSLLLIITAEFGTGIQLGFGFTLIGVGGLLGLNRTMMLEPLAAGIRTGAINSIMFPPDPVANAPRIISDLRTYFPPYEGKFLIGPMVKIGWGTPTLVSLAFGLIIEIPGNIAIVGVLKVALPTEEAAIISINVGFIGALEFDKSRVWFYAALFDSRILFMTLEGEMGMLMAWGDDANFVLSVGGFHPSFTPPPLPFPNPRRLRLDVLRQAAARISVETYFAVTSNTVQFGARAELFFGADDFNINGHFSFDALFQFSPFRFIIEISFSVGMEVFGADLFSVRLRFTLEGPGLWRASGTGTLSIDLWLFSIDISVDFDITWGEEDVSRIDPVQGIPLLKTEFGKLDNWKVNVPESNNIFVTLRKLDTNAETLVLHPMGTIRISQRAIPLGINVDKIGNAPVSDAHLFSVIPDTADLGKTSQAPTEKFAIAQFQNLSDSEKLSRPSFQDIEGGVELTFDGKQLSSSKIAKRIVRYEVKMIDNNYKRFSFKWFTKVGTLFFHWLDGAAVTQSPISFAAKKAMVPTTIDERVAVKQPGFVVANVANNKPVTGTKVFASEAHAFDYYNKEISLNPGMASEMHVIPGSEAILS